MNQECIDPGHNLQPLMEIHGVSVYSQNLPLSVSGLTVAVPEGFIIVVNSNHHKERRPIDIAREFNHILHGNVNADRALSVSLNQKELRIN